MSLEVIRQGRVCVLTINRPAARNALTVDLRDAVAAAFAEFDADASMLVAVITGAGQEAFCAGSDLKQPPQSPSPAPIAIFDRRDVSIVPEIATAKPVIAAINGHALGGGLELALACDIRIASANAVLGMPEVRIGSMPGGGGTQRLPRLVGPGNALHMLLSGERISAERALSMGLVNKVVSPDRLRICVMELADRIAANAPLAVRAVKRAVKEGLEMPLPNGLAFERSLFTLIRDTADRAEGRRAFAEKRQPEFKGE
jgi:E-phenylitaconyl-CoA hydratase